MKRKGKVGFGGIPKSRWIEYSKIEARFLAEEGNSFKAIKSIVGKDLTDNQIRYAMRNPRKRQDDE